MVFHNSGNSGLKTQASCFSIAVYEEIAGQGISTSLAGFSVSAVSAVFLPEHYLGQPYPVSQTLQIDNLPSTDSLAAAFPPRLPGIGLLGHIQMYGLSLCPDNPHSDEHDEVFHQAVHGYAGFPETLANSSGC